MSTPKFLVPLYYSYSYSFLTLYCHLLSRARAAHGGHRRAGSDARRGERRRRGVAPIKIALRSGGHVPAAFLQQCHRRARIDVNNGHDLRLPQLARQARWRR